MSDAGARRCNIPFKGKKLLESERKKFFVESWKQHTPVWPYCLLSTKNNSQPWLNKSDGAQTDVFRWKWPKMSISKLSLALKRMGSILSSFFFLNCLTTLSPETITEWFLRYCIHEGFPVIGLNWFQNVAIYIVISHYF